MSALLPKSYDFGGFNFRLVDRLPNAAVYSQHHTDAPGSPLLAYQVVRVKQTLQELVGRPPIVCRETMYREDWMNPGLMFGHGQFIRACARALEIHKALLAPVPA